MPNVDLTENFPDNKVNLANLCQGKTVVLFGVPGAFTPGCSKVNFCENLYYIPIIPRYTKLLIVLIYN